MLWAAVIVGILALIVLIGGACLIAVKISQTSAEIAVALVNAHQSTLDSLETIHSRNMTLLGDMADRFMSLDFERFKSYQGTEEMEGGFEEPEETTRLEVPIGRDRVAVVGAAAEARARAEAEERKLLREDFPEEFEETA